MRDKYNSNRKVAMKVDGNIDDYLLSKQAKL